MTTLHRGDLQDAYRRIGGKQRRLRRSVIVNVNLNVNGFVLPRKHSGQLTPTAEGHGIRIVEENTTTNIQSEGRLWRTTLALIPKAQRVTLTSEGIRIREGCMKIPVEESGRTRHEEGASVKVLTIPTLMRQSSRAPHTTTSREQKLGPHPRVIHAAQSHIGPSRPHINSRRRRRLRHHRPQNPKDVHLVVARVAPGTAAAQDPERVPDHPRS